MKNKKTEFTEEGEKVTEESCPHCKQELVVRMDDGGSEVFVCENCKFVKKKK